LKLKTAVQKILKVAKRDRLSRFLESISIISEACIAKLDNESNNISSIAASTDNTLILYSELRDVASDISTSLNLPDVKKLNRIIDNIPDDSIELVLENNNIKYKGAALRFTYHLYEDGSLLAPAINIDKIKSFKHDVSFELSRNDLKNIIKGSVFASESNKVYFYTEGGELKCELTDRAKHNTDALSLTLCPADFELAPIPVNLDNVKALNVISETIKFGVNTEYGVLVVDIEDSDISLKYIITSLTQ
jgi:hypothetical protein